jgi:hypothetical protein
MNRRTEHLFIWITAEILFVLGAVVWLTSFRHAAVLSRTDELFHLANRAVFRVIGTLALLASAYLLISRNKRQTIPLAAWLALSILLYSLRFRWQEQANLLNYLGNMNNLPISPAFVAWVIYVALGFVIGGGGWWLIGEWLASRKSARSNKPISTPGKLEKPWDLGPEKTKEGEAGAGG